MERPIYECIAYDTGSELEDLRLFRKDIEDYTDFVEKERNKQLALCKVGISFIHELIQKETGYKTKLAENLDLYKKLNKMDMFERTFDLWNKQNLVLWDLKDILCRMGQDID